jgi:hypothetical protein
MDVATVWRDFFVKWPKELPRQGVLVTNLDEQIGFAGFMTGETMLLVDRRAPDTVGARKVILPYANIAALKLVDVVKAKTLQSAGFVGDLPNQ